MPPAASRPEPACWKPQSVAGGVTATVLSWRHRTGAARDAGVAMASVIIGWVWQLIAQRARATYRETSTDTGHATAADRGRWTGHPDGEWGTMTHASRGHLLLRAAGSGAACGLVGVAVMTTAEKLEQRFTGRPNSYIPARALLSLLGRHPGHDERPWGWNHAMHWGTGAALGAVRGIWAVTGIRGPVAHAWHTIVRLAVDQTVENATGVGAPPMTWPRQEKVVDVAHKALYSVATGMLADRCIDPVLRSTRGRTSH